MKYNRALDLAALALDSLVQNKPVLAARLLAKAAQQGDVKDAINIIEFSNKTALAAAVAKPETSKKVEASKKVKAAEEETEMCAAEDDVDFEADPLDEIDVEDQAEEDSADDESEVEVEEEQEVPAKVMARVLNRMIRRP